MNGFTEEGAAETLRAACRTVSLDASGATLIRLGENAIFRLPAPDVVARSARTVEYLPDVEKEVAAARWLTRHDVPATSIAEAYAQPLVSRGRVVTFWEYIAPGSPDATVIDLALLLRARRAGACSSSTSTTSPSAPRSGT